MLIWVGLMPTNNRNPLCLLPHGCNLVSDTSLLKTNRMSCVQEEKNNSQWRISHVFKNLLLNVCSGIRGGTSVPWFMATSGNHSKLYCEIRESNSGHLSITLLQPRIIWEEGSTEGLPGSEWPVGMSVWVVLITDGYRRARSTVAPGRGCWPVWGDQLSMELRVSHGCILHCVCCTSLAVREFSKKKIFNMIFIFCSSQPPLSLSCNLTNVLYSNIFPTLPETSKRTNTSVLVVIYRAPTFSDLYLRSHIVLRVSVSTLKGKDFVCSSVRVWTWVPKGPLCEKVRGLGGATNRWWAP